MRARCSETVIKKPGLTELLMDEHKADVHLVEAFGAVAREVLSFP